MKPKCEWKLNKDIDTPFGGVIVTGTSCSFDNAENFYKDKDGKTYCLFHAPSDAVNIKTKKMKSEELNLFQKEIDVLYQKYNSDQKKLKERIDDLFNQGLSSKEVEKNLKEEKLSPLYDFVGVVFTFDVFLLNPDCVLKKERIEMLGTKYLYIPSKGDFGLLGLMSFLGCNFKGIFEAPSFDNERFSQEDKVDHSLSYLVLNNSIFHKGVSFSNYNIEELFCEECIFKGSLSLYNTYIKKASFRKSLFDNKMAFADFSCKDNNHICNEEPSNQRNMWDFREIKFFGEVSFENRVFYSRTDFTQVTFYDKFYFYNTKLYPETYFYKTNFIKRSDYGMDICFNYLIKELKNIEQYQQIKTIEEYAQESYAAILRKFDDPKLEEKEWVDDIFQKEKELFRKNPETMHTRKARLKEIGKLYPYLKHKKNNGGKEGVPYSNEGFVTKYTKLALENGLSFEKVEKK